MKYEELRKKVQKHPKHEGCVEIDRSPLIHAGFPGTFNLSFTEHPWLQEFGKYMGFDHDYHFSTIQSCIRPNDIPLIGGEGSWKYLGVFEMGGLNGMLTFRDYPGYREIQGSQIKDLVSFLQDLGVSKERIHPSYCVGGNVRELTNGKYEFDLQIPEDNISKEGFLEAGVPEENLIRDQSRDTFLSLNLLHEAGSGGTTLSYSPWGYRNEINVKMLDGRLLDVGTFERFEWAPIWEERNIVGLSTLKNGFFLSGLGLERTSMVDNDLERVQDVDFIKPFYDLMEDQIGDRNPLSGESLRALHRIYSDVKKFDLGELSKPRKKRLRKILQNIPKNLNYSQIKDLLQVHSETQPWHPEMKDGIESAIERIKVYRGGRK